ncbi:hypothetical protein HGRIS_003730 [Hohenbuehelia grisea]|uniref:Metallo-beta-lactamase domain-containing protein n=1 Tax=Hohenbuehelia grisea TaxID=104357 RepID=A0ABR3JH40_9AGAR
MSSILERMPAFESRRLVGSTFLIRERDDVYDEHPHIYAKINPGISTIVIIDTGCGGASNDPDVGVTSLREFIETVDVADNDHKPLNKDGSMSYVIVLSHCHYDHILAVEQFSDAVILASANSPEFVDSENLPAHSLCDALGLRTPSYESTLVPHKHEIPETGMIILHTPGHTPDELAVYDYQERMLYVGDTLYEHAPIIFPKEGSIIEWFTSVNALISLVQSEKVDDGGQRLQISAGHETAGQPALAVLTSTKAFMQGVIEGKEPVRERMVKRGEETVMYRQDNGVYSLICPERLVLEARAVQCS